MVRRVFGGCGDALSVPVGTFVPNEKPTRIGPRQPWGSIVAGSRRSWR